MSRRRSSVTFLSAACLALSLVGARPARAQVVPNYVFDAPPTPAWGTPAQPSPPEPPETPQRWYGGWILAADGLALVSTAAISSADDSLGPKLWAAAWLLDGPVVHVAHARPGAAVGSLALRVGLPIAGGALGYLVETGGRPDRSEWFDGLGGALIGGLVGIVAAETVDTAALAWKSERAPAHGTTAIRAGVAPMRGGAALSLGGAF
jgi:hypothetical protein